MKIRTKHTSLFISLCALMACSENDVVQPDITPDGEKTLVSLSVGGVDGNINKVETRVITDGTDKTLVDFEYEANIFMLMKSEYYTFTGDNAYYNYGGSTDTKYCVTKGVVTPDKDNDTFDEVVFPTGNERYWDDAHARSSQLSIYAFVSPGTQWSGNDQGKFEGNKSVQGWTTSEIKPIIDKWAVSTASGYAQNLQTIKNQNLCYSNNLTNNTTGDKRLRFQTTSPKGFTGGNMIFYHAMSKITIQFKIGNGYTSTDPFKFTTGNVKLYNYNVEGQNFKIDEGEFTTTTSGTIASIYDPSNNTPNRTATYAYTLEGLTVPGSTLSDGETATSMEFTIDNNTYKVSQDALYDALKAIAANNITESSVTFEAGKNYIFTFTIGKKQIDNLTAQVAEWEKVTADEFTPSNARIKIKVEERGTEQTTNLNIFRGLNTATTIDDNWASYDWNTPTYENISATYESGQWTSPLFWESNMHFYHFRSLMPNTVALASDKNSVDLTSAVSYTDVLWGAPMLDDEDDEDPSTTLKWNYGPTAKGFDGKDDATTHQIYKAIGPTNDRIKLIMFHMMSDLTIKLQTTTGTDAVDFGTGSGESVTTVELVDYKANGKLLLGNGLVTATGDAGVSVISNTVNNSSLTCTYGAIPQDLTNVKLRITTADGNQYIVNMGERVATAVPTETNLNNPYTLSNGKYAINRWYPGYKYIYTFTLKKTGITNITATIVNWETVTADPDDVYIK